MNRYTTINNAPAPESLFKKGLTMKERRSLFIKKAWWYRADSHEHLMENGEPNYQLEDESRRD